MRQWADEHAPGVDVATETERFLDRNRSKGGEYVDWLAAWRNWLTSPYAKAPAVPARASPNGQHPMPFAPVGKDAERIAVAERFRARRQGQ
jgi:hypothetical protein